MKKWRLPRLSRGGKIARNLLAALGLLILLWGMNGFPIHSPRLEFRRGELENWIGRSEILGSFAWNDCQCTVGIQEDQVLLRRTRGGRSAPFVVWPRNPEGAVLVPPMEYTSFPKKVPVVAADVPEGTDSARLEVTVGCWHGDRDLSRSQHIAADREDFGPKETPLWWERTYAAQGEPLGDGGMLFWVVCPDEHTDPAVNLATVERTAMEALRFDTFYRSAQYRSIDCRMEAVFYGEKGEELGRARLETGEGGTRDAV